MNHQEEQRYSRGKATEEFMNFLASWEAVIGLVAFVVVSAIVFASISIWNRQGSGIKQSQKVPGEIRVAISDYGRVRSSDYLIGANTSYSATKFFTDSGLLVCEDMFIVKNGRKAELHSFNSGFAVPVSKRFAVFRDSLSVDSCEITSKSM